MSEVEFDPDKSWKYSVGMIGYLLSGYKFAPRGDDCKGKYTLNFIGERSHYNEV